MKTKNGKQKLLVNKNYRWKTEFTVDKQKLQLENNNQSRRISITVGKKITVKKSILLLENKNYSWQTKTTVGKQKLQLAKKIQLDNEKCKCQTYFTACKKIELARNITESKHNLQLANKKQELPNKLVKKYSWATTVIVFKQKLL